MIDGFMSLQGEIIVKTDDTNGIDGLMRMTCECEEWGENPELYISQVELKRSHTAKRPQRPLALVYCLVDR